MWALLDPLKDTLVNVNEAFGLDGRRPALVQKCESALYEAERRDLMELSFSRQMAPKGKIIPWMPDHAEQAWLKAYRIAERHKV